jgi:hypothetical protein
MNKFTTQLQQEVDRFQRHATTVNSPPPPLTSSQFPNVRISPPLDNHQTLSTLIHKFLNRRENLLHITGLPPILTLLQVYLTMVKKWNIRFRTYHSSIQP